MIDVRALVLALPDLTGDASKVGVFMSLLENAELRADAAWRAHVGRALVLSPAVIEKALRELADAQLIELSNRVNVRAKTRSMSEGGGTLALCSPATSPSNVPQSPAAAASCESSSGEQDKLASGFATPDGGGSPKRRAAKREASASAVRRLVDGQIETAASDDPPSQEVRRCIDRFDALFRDANGGAKPTWGARQYVTMRQLVTKHGADEVEKRIVHMFTAPPRFPAPPYDLQTLVVHFDKFAQPGTLRGGMIDRWQSGEDYYAGAKR